MPWVFMPEESRSPCMMGSIGTLGFITYLGMVTVWWAISCSRGFQAIGLVVSEWSMKPPPYFLASERLCIYIPLCLSWDFAKSLSSYLAWFVSISLWCSDILGSNLSSAYFLGVLLVSGFHLPNPAAPLCSSSCRLSEANNASDAPSFSSTGALFSLSYGFAFVYAANLLYRSANFAWCYFTSCSLTLSTWSSSSCMMSYLVTLCFRLLPGGSFGSSGCRLWSMDMSGYSWARCLGVIR